METEWRVARARLRELIQENPQIGHEEASYGWAIQSRGSANGANGSMRTAQMKQR